LKPADEDELDSDTEAKPEIKAKIKAINSSTIER
jgi:hypothetical protein